MRLLAKYIEKGEDRRDFRKKKLAINWSCTQDQTSRKYLPLPLTFSFILWTNYESWLDLHLSKHVLRTYVFRIWVFFKSHNLVNTKHSISWKSALECLMTKFHQLQHETFISGVFSRFRRRKKNKSNSIHVWMLQGVTQIKILNFKLIYLWYTST